MGMISNWILFTPLLPALLLLAYVLWQAYKEINPTMQQFTSLQREIQKTREIVDSFLPEAQSIKSRVMEQRQIARELISDSKETYGKARQLVGTVAALDTTPVHRGIVYFKQYREDRRLPQGAKFVRKTARKLRSKLNRRDFRQVSSMLALVFSATALLFTVRFSRSHRFHS